MRVRPKADPSLGWAYRPDSDTVAALTRGTKKLKGSYFNPGADRPHYGGNLAEALVAARKAEDKRRGITGKRRRKKVAKKVTLKELHSRKGRPASKKKTASKKRTAVKEPTGKLIPLKTICADLDLDPKATRVKLRRMIAKGEIDWHDANSRWEFTPQRAKEVRALLS